MATKVMQEHLQRKTRCLVDLIYPKMESLGVSVERNARINFSRRNIRSSGVCEVVLLAKSFAAVRFGELTTHRSLQELPRSPRRNDKVRLPQQTFGGKRAPRGRFGVACADRH